MMFDDGTPTTVSAAPAMMSDVSGPDVAAAPLVGRDAELASLTKFLVGDDAGPPGAGVVLLGGDAGIGKTRLLREVADRARAADARVLIGHCVHHGGDAVAYLPITEAFGRLARHEPQTVEALLTQFSGIEVLLPRRRVRGASDAGAPVERAELFEAVLGAMLSLAAERPLLLVLEDMHWADEATRDLVGFLATRLFGEPVMLIASYRSDDLHRRHPLRGPLLEWGRLPGVERLALDRLPAQEITRLLRGQNAALPDTDVAEIVERAGGNAFYAEQLLAESAHDGTSRGLPADLADLLLVRVERLSATARNVVRVVAVAGRRLDHARLAEVGDLPSAELDAAVREAVEAYVLERRGDEFGIRHALLAEAVYDDLLPGERARLHAAFVEALSRPDVPGADADLARHAQEAGDLPTAYHAALRAADEAMTLAAPAEAGGHYLTAIRLAGRIGHMPEGLEPARPPDELAMQAAHAAERAGHPFRAIRLAAEAVAELPADGDPMRRAELLLAQAELALPWDTGDIVQAIAWEALNLVPAEPPSALRARAMEIYARAVSHDDQAASLTWAAEARATALMLDLPDVAVEAAITQARGHRALGAFEDAETLLRTTFDEAGTLGDLNSQLRLLHGTGLLRYKVGDMAGASRAWRDAADRGRAGGRPWATYAMDSRVHSIRVEFQLGEWDEALALAADLVPPPPAFVAASVAAAGLPVRQARGAEDIEAQVAASKRWWSVDGGVLLDAGSALLEHLAKRGRADDIEAATAVHGEMVELLSTMWGPTFQAHVRLNALLAGALADHAPTVPSDRRDSLVRQATQLRDDANTSVQGLLARGVSVGRESHTWALRAEAELLRLRWRAGIDAPDLGELVGAWTAVVAGFDGDFVYEQTRSRARLAAVLQAAGRRDEAQTEADAARAVARRLRAVFLLAELDGLSVPVTREPAAADEPALTPREEQVLALLAEGRTNRQIGRSLFISEKTVSVHVSNLLAKLGAGGRGEAVAVARRDGLLD